MIYSMLQACLVEYLIIQDDLFDFTRVLFLDVTITFSE